MAARCSKFFGIMIVELEVKKTESASVNDREVSLQLYKT